MAESPVGDPARRSMSMMAIHDDKAGTGPASERGGWKRRFFNFTGSGRTTKKTAANEAVKEAQEAFSDAVLQGQVDANKILTALWNFCTMDRRSLVIFIFNAYSAALPDALTIEEVKRLLRDIHADRAALDAAFDQFLRECRAEGGAAAQSLLPSTPVPLGRFFHVVANKPGLVGPLFELQEKFRDAVLGHAFWAERETVRRELIGKHLLDPKELEESYKTSSYEQEKSVSVVGSLPLQGVAGRGHLGTQSSVIQPGVKRKSLLRPSRFAATNTTNSPTNKAV